MLVDDAGGACLRRGQARWLDDESAWAFCMNCAWNELDALPRDVAVADDSAMAARAELEDWAVDFAFALLFFSRAQPEEHPPKSARAKEMRAPARLDPSTSLMHQHWHMRGAFSEELCRNQSTLRTASYVATVSES